MASATPSTFRAPVVVESLTYDQAHAVESALNRLADELAFEDGNAFPTGEFNDFMLFVDLRQPGYPRNDDFEVVEDDGNLHMNFGHFRLSCNMDQDSSRSELVSVQRRFAKVARRFFETYAAQFESLLPVA